MVNNKNKDIFLVLSQSCTNFAKVIRYYTKEPYAHVSLAFDEDLEEMYSFGRKRTTNPFAGGFVNERVDGGTYARYAQKVCIYKLEINEDQYTQLRQYIDEFKKNSEKHTYNIVGIAGVVVGVPIKRKYKYFCSQFVAYILQKSGIDLVDKPYEAASPSDFREKLEEIGADKIYEGTVANLVTTKNQPSNGYVVLNERVN
ncbi:MAG: hypothetical protein K0R15_1864 [Clostridiales bacterium]|jgi:hypothetical protein|nr:hypothetical protein [Clostridiales bacterium]